MDRAAAARRIDAGAEPRRRRLGAARKAAERGEAAERRSDHDDRRRSFCLLGVVAVGSALLVVTTRQLVHAALWLVVTLGALAGCYLLLTAEFVAWVQVLIYVGAVVVLLLFALMLTRAPIGRSRDLDCAQPAGRRAGRRRRPPGCWSRWSSAASGARHRRWTGSRSAAAQALGAALFRTWVLPFEVLSVLLLAALVGAIVLSRRDAPASRRPAAGPRTRPRPPRRQGAADAAAVPLVVAALLFAIGVYGVLARRNAILVLMGSS